MDRKILLLNHVHYKQLPHQMLFHISIRKKVKFKLLSIKWIQTPKISANFSFDHVNGILDTCKRNVPSSSSNIFNEDDGVL
jgi:hypothetical protein